MKQDKEKDNNEKVVIVEKENKELGLVTDKILKNKKKWYKFGGKKKQRARIGTAFVYEYIGQQEVFDGAYPLLKGGVKDVAGDYTVIDYKGKMKYLSTPDPQDYTPTFSQIKKILHVVKYAEDDFRIRKSLDEDYYKEEIIYLEKEEKVMSDDGKEILSVQMVPDLIEEGEDKGQQKYEINKVYYKKPSAIIQEGREAIKEGNEYEKKMAEWRKKEESWFKKNAIALMSYAVIMMLLVTVMFLGGKTVDEFSEIRNQIYDDNQKTRDYISNGLINGLAEKVSQKQMENENPPE